MRGRFLVFLALAGMLCGCVKTADAPSPSFSAVEPGTVPKSPSAWTEATIAALRAEGVVLVNTVPDDIGGFCPGYATAPKSQREAFWAGLFSKMALIGGQSGPSELTMATPVAAPEGVCAHAALPSLSPQEAALSCKVADMARQVVADGAIAGNHDGWLGIARDWLPFRDKGTRQGIAAWTANQAYCS